LNIWIQSTRGALATLVWTPPALALAHAAAAMQVRK
jgi:hypothetical protein